MSKRRTAKPLPTTSPRFGLPNFEAAYRELRRAIVAHKQGGFAGEPTRETILSRLDRLTRLARTGPTSSPEKTT